MTGEMEFIKIFPYLSGCSTTSPHDMDNLLDELSLDVAEVLVKNQHLVQYFIGKFLGQRSAAGIRLFWS
jgi:hypothetical protein